MNFLLHHHLAARDLGSDAAAVGAMLPDLWRMADRRVRPASAHRDGGAALAAAIDAGIAHHLAADAWFHAADVFASGERTTRAHLREAAASVPRIGLFAHVVWEMALDGALVRARGMGPLRDALRSVRDAAIQRASDEAAAAHHFTRVEREPGARAAFAARMRRLFDAIAGGEWIEGYADGAGLARRAEGVRARVGLAPLSAGERDALTDACRGVLDDAERALDHVLGAPRFASLTAPEPPPCT